MADPPVEITFEQAYQEALAYFAARVPVDGDTFAALTDRAKHRAFAITGLAEMGVITDIWRVMERELEQGVDFRAFQRDVLDDFLVHWKGSPTAAPARLQLVFQNAAQSAFNAGRYTQMRDPDVLEARPYWMYDGVADRRQSAICREIDGIILPANHPYFIKRWPPLHHGCRTSVRTLTRAEATRRGVTSEPLTLDPGDGFGAIPPLADWSPQKADYPPQLWAAYDAKQAAGE